MCLNVSQYLRPDIQISISARIYEVSRSNNDEYVGLSCFVGRFIISVRRCMLRGDNTISRGAIAGYPVCPNPVSLVELRGQIVMFS